MVYIWIEQLKDRLLAFRHWFRKLFCRNCYLSVNTFSLKETLKCRETDNLCKYFNCPKREKCHMNCEAQENNNSETMA